MKKGEAFQISLIFLGLVVTALFGVFLYREIFPEYRVYQNDYVALEEFRSTYTGQPPPPFKFGVKQIVIEKEDKGPADVDRCISCHVALKIPDFSPTKIAYDVNGNLRLDEEGWPLKVPNENYVFAKLKELDPKKYEELKSSEKVLQMHPLMGRETRPFEYHPVEEYGCVSCHGGNGRGLTAEKAHGPVFDGQYEAEFVGEVPQFLEKDPENDPKFSRVFNAKPGHTLLFQTTPILVGSLMQAKCVQCHQTSASAIQSAVGAASYVASRRMKKSEAIEEGLIREKQELQTLLEMRSKGKKQMLEVLEKRSQDFTLSPEEQEEASSQLKFLKKADEKEINEKIVAILGSPGLAKELESSNESLDDFLNAHLDDDEATGTIFVKLARANLEKAVERHIKETETSLKGAASGSIISDIDYLTQGYHRGQDLYLTQGCYACHRITGFARGGIGPELTRAGEDYPWRLKESIVWPQADLKTSTMPNFHLDHEEVEHLMTYLLAQKGPKGTQAEKVAIKEWEAGKKQPWEKPVTPAQINDVRFGMTVFATQGCAACHRLLGYESNVGFAVEKNSPTFDELYKEKEWFASVFPEEITGTELIEAINENKEQIDERLVDGVRTGSLLAELEANDPKLLESFYPEFKFAQRANKDPSYQKRLHLVLMQYIQQYGLGRLIGPRPNWSGIYRSDEWLMEHFRNPSALIARSIMPVLPFDETKYLALTRMLDILAKKNRDALHKIWKNRGFDPEQAVQTLCAQCHGEFLHGHGPVSEWIYPIPKNLRNASFLRNLTRERVQQSIRHGVKGTPMPPWGEVATDKPTADGIPVLNEEQITQITDWLFASLPGGRVIRDEKDVPKWQYKPEDVIQEVTEEGDADKLTVAAVFDIEPHPVLGEEEKGYYIKKKYYTAENLWQGKRFFEINCAVCHGKEGTGAGERAESMVEAKPRMLANLNWIETRDDLRLLRSIKYGVTGTSMTPWGDQTSSLQRLQLVMYIRTLSAESEMRNQLFSALYKSYNQAEIVIEDARASGYQELVKVEEELEKTKKRQRALYLDVQEGKAQPEEAAQVYQEELKLMGELQEMREKDQLFKDLKAEVKKERGFYQSLGLTLIQKMMGQDTLNALVQLIKQNEGRYSLKEGKLEMKKPTSDEKLEEKLFADIQTRIDSLEKEKKLLEGKIASAPRNLELSNVMTEISALQTLKNKTISYLEQAKRSQEKQREIHGKL